MSIFKKIINREVQSDIIYEQENLIVIRDINPQAKTHLLIIPKKQIESINALKDGDRDLISDMFFVAKKIANDLGISEGYQLKFNVGSKGGQEIMHLHLHLLSNI